MNHSRTSKKSHHRGARKILLASLVVAALACGTTAYANDTPASGTETDTLVNQIVRNYDHPDRDLVINWDERSNTLLKDGSAIRNGTVNARNITIDANFGGNQWTDKGIISEGTTHVTASEDINVKAHDDAVYTQSSGTITIDGFKNLNVTSTGSGYGLVDNGNGITVNGGEDSTVTITTSSQTKAAIGNSILSRMVDAFPPITNRYAVGTGITINAGRKISLHSDYTSIFAGIGKNGTFNVNLNAPTVEIKGMIETLRGGTVTINPDIEGVVTISAGQGKGASANSILASGKGSNVSINKNHAGLVQITGDVQANTGASIDLNMAGNGSFLNGNLKTDVSSGSSYKANDNASITARFTGTNAQMTGDIQTVTDHSTITADFSGENGTLTGDVKAAGLAPTKSYSGWKRASGTTLNLNMTGAHTSQKGNLVADGSNTLNANYTGTGSSLKGNANNTGIMNLTFDNQSQMTGDITNGHAYYDDGTFSDGQLKADFNNGSRWTGNLNHYTGSSTVNLTNGSLWTGDLTNTSGTTAVNLDGSIWEGAANGDGDLGTRDITLTNGSLWSLSADSMVNSVNLDRGSVISLAGPAHTLETMSLGGSGGTFLMDLNYQGDDVNTYREGDSSDYIVAHGGNGSTYGVALSGDSNVNGMTEGSKLYFATTAADSSAFRLDQDVEVRNFNKIYNKNLSVLKDTGNLSVKKDTDTTDSDFKGADNWYLTPDASKGHDGDTINPNGTVPGAVANAAFALWRDDDTLLKRLGELRNDSGDDGIWARMVNKHLERDGRHSFEGNYKTIQVGYDKKKDTENNGSWYYGGAISHLWGDTNYTDGHGSQKETDLSLYGTNIRPHGHYLDLIARVGRIDSDYTTSYGDHGKFENWGMSFGAEYGRQKALGGGWSIEPQAQLTYHYLWGDDYTTRNGAKVSQDNADSLVGRLGFLLSREFNAGTDHAGRVYLKASILHDFLGDTTSTIVDDIHYRDDDDLGDTWYIAGIGTDINLGKNTRFYFDAERNFNADVKMKYRFNAGLRFGF